MIKIIHNLYSDRQKYKLIKNPSDIDLTKYSYQLLNLTEKYKTTLYFDYDNITRKQLIKDLQKL